MGLFSEYREVNRILQEKQPVVFYAESRHYYQYFERLINDLVKQGLTRICYITSDKADPLLKNPPPGIKAIYCNMLLGFLFSRIRAEVMVLTMPDLGNYLFRRSPHVGEYVYVFHAAVSTHLQYTKTAFFNYDTVFCTGEYQVRELQQAEELYAIKPKTLLRYGYPLLDTLSSVKTKPADEETILIAPSWFEGCIFETCLEKLLQELAVLPYRVIVRSHPEYEKRYPQEFRRVCNMVSSFTNMFIDVQPDVMHRLPQTAILITDRSGIAFEFAMGVFRPVLFIDTVFKQNNPDWKDLGIEPVEIDYRSEMGVSIAPDQLDGFTEKLEELAAFSNGFEQRMRQLKQKLFFNSEENYRSGADHLIGRIGKAQAL